MEKLDVESQAQTITVFPRDDPQGATTLGVGRTSILQREAIRLFAHGWTGRRVADALGITEHTLTKWTRDPEWAEAVRRFDEGADDTVMSVRERFQLGALRMLDVILGVAESPDAKHADKLSAADSWLDRSGYPRMKVEFGKHQHNLSAEPGFWERFQAVREEVGVMKDKPMTLAVANIEGSRADGEDKYAP